MICRPVVLLCLLLLTGLTNAAFGQASPSSQAQKEQYELIEDIAYRDAEQQSDYMRERCKLDLYRPVGIHNYPTVVWFHGGGLKAGSKSVPKALKEQGIAVVAVNYRLSPKVKSPAYIEDAAAAVAWTFHHIAKHGGSAKKIFVSGHSAGGYLTSMVGMDQRWLAKHHIDCDKIAGLIPYSGHSITHFTIRQERGLTIEQPVVDDMAPLYHVRKDCPPLLLITGDRELEMAGRYEETAYLWRMMQFVKHPDTTLHELDGYNHGQMAEPAHPLLLRFVQQHSKAIDSSSQSQ